MSEWTVVEHNNGMVVVVDREEFHVVCTVHKGSIDKPEQLAYAKVISCAPEMAEMLQVLSCYAPKGSDDAKAVEALLKKAGVRTT